MILDHSGKNEKNACFLISILDCLDMVLIWFKLLLMIS